MPAALIGAAASPIVGGLIGHFAAQGDQDAANAQIQQALQEIQSVPTPELKQLVLEKYKSAGVLTPEMEQTIKQEPSLMGNIQIDPRLKEAQMMALNRMSAVGQKGGLLPEDIAALTQVQKQADIADQAKQGQILQEMQQRGQGGGGAELAARLSAGQQGANRISEEGLNIAGMANQRALQALMNAGQLGGSIRGQDFGEEAAKAQAQDAINRFNAQNAQAVANQNVNRANYGQQYNLQNLQNISNANADMANRAQEYANQMKQQQYLDALQKAQSAAVAHYQNANQDMANAQMTRNMFGSIGQGVGSALGGYAAGQASGDALGSRLKTSPTGLIQNPEDLNTDNTFKQPKFGSQYPSNQ